MGTVYTIGVYGSDRSSFFGALENARADVFLDIRTRRAVRGPRYTYANAQRLIAELQARGIAYRHVRELAPGYELLALQHAADAEQGLRYSARTELSSEYLRRYRAEVLNRFDFDALARDLDGFKAPVFFCIERIPQACHRSLVAPKLARALGAEDVVHLIPQAATGGPPFDPELVERSG